MKKQEQITAGLENLNITNEMFNEVLKQQDEFRSNVFDYVFADNRVADQANSLKVGERKKLEQTYNFSTMSDSEVSKFAEDLLKLRGFTQDEIDNLLERDMVMLGHKVLFTTFDAKSIAAKK